MAGWNQIRPPNPPMQMNQNSPMVGGGNMMMGNFGMNQPYQMSGRQMMYPQPYMQQSMYPQPMMNAYRNMTATSQMNHHSMQPQAPLPSTVPNQPPPPAPSEPPPPHASAPLPPSDDKRCSSQPPPPDSAKEWWKTEMENLTGSSRQDLQVLTTTDWFLAMDTNQQIEYWQHKMQLKLKQEKSVQQSSSCPSTQGNTDSSQHQAAYGASIQSKPSVTTSQAHTNSQSKDAPKQSESSTTNKNDQEVAPEWDKTSGENPQEALKRYQKQLKKLDEQAAVFEKQYNDWRKQFDDWKDKHRNHPNKTQFNQYEKQWVTWQKQMIEQKKQNEINKNRLLDNVRKIEEVIEDEKKINERSQQMGFPGRPNVTESQYQQPNAPSSQASSFPPNQFQDPAYSQQIPRGSNSNQRYGNEQFASPGSFNNNMRPSRPPFDQARPNQMQSGSDCLQVSSLQQQVRGNTPQQWQRMPPSQQGMPGFNQQRPSIDTNLNQNAKIDNASGLQVNSTPQQQVRGNVPQQWQRMPSHQQRMPGFNQQRPSMNTNQNPKIENESVKKPQRNEYDEYGNLITSATTFEGEPLHDFKFANNQQERSTADQGPGSFGNITQRPRYPGDLPPRSQYSRDQQQRPRFPGAGEQRAQFPDTQQRPRFIGDQMQRSRFPGDSEQRGQFPGDQHQRARFPVDQQQRQRFSNNEQSKPRLSGDFSEDQQKRRRFSSSEQPKPILSENLSEDQQQEADFDDDEWQSPRFPGNQQHQPRFPGNNWQRQLRPGQQRPRFPGEQQRPRLPGDARQRPRFPGDGQQRPRFPGDAQQRPRFPGDAQQRPRFSGDAQQRPRFSADAQQRPRFPGDAQQRPRFPGDAQQRSRFPGDAQQRTRFPGDAQQRSRFPGDAQQRSRFPGDAQQRSRFPGDAQQRPRFPGDAQNKQRFPGDAQQRQRFPGDAQNRQRFPGDAQNRQRFPGEFQSRSRFSKDPPQRPRFPGHLQKRPSLSGGDDNSSVKDTEENADYAKDDEYSEWDQSSSNQPFQRQTSRQSKEEQDIVDVFVDGEEVTDYLKHQDEPEKELGNRPSQQFGGKEGPRFPGPRGPRFGGRGAPGRMQNPNDFGRLNDGYNSRFSKPMLQQGSRPRFPNQPPLRRPLSPSSRFEGRNPQERFRNPSNYQSEEWRQEGDKSYGDRSERYKPDDDSSLSEDITLNAARKLAESNPLFSGDNMRKLQEQLKMITQNRNKSNQEGPSNEAQQGYDESNDKTIDSGKILEKAKNVSSLDLKNILSAVKMSAKAKADTPKDDHGMSSEERAIGGGRPRGMGGRPGPDPLLNSLEELAAMGALEDDTILQEYLRTDPLLEEELYIRAMQDKELLLEARKFDQQHEWAEDGSRDGPRRRAEELRPDRPDWYWEGEDQRMSDAERPRGFGSPPRRGMPARDEDRWMGGENRPMDRPFRDRPFYDRPGDPMRRPGPDGYDGRDRSPFRDLREASQRDLERQSIERRHRDIDRDLASVKQRRETLDNIFVYDERDDERQQRERSLERLRMRESDLHQREKDILAREHALRDALRQYSPSRKRQHDETRRRREDDDYMRRGPPEDREAIRQAYPSFDKYDVSDRGGRGSPGRALGRDRFHPNENHPRGRELRERDERDRERRRSPSPRREGMRRREMMDRNRDRASPRRRSPPRKLRRSRSRTPPRGTKDEFGRELSRGRPLFNKGVPPRTHEPSPRRLNSDKHPASKTDPKAPSNMPASPPAGPDVLIQPTGKPITFADLQESQDKLQPPKPVGPLFVNVEDMLNMPGRLKRPPKIVVLFRGLPGCGKTHIAKMIRDKESSFKVSARVLGLDDYFMTEVEKSVKDPDTGKMTKKRVFEYEYEEDMEESYRGNLVRSFKKTLEDGYFTFVIVDSINNKVAYFSECYNAAKSAGFEVYIAELSADVHVCAKRNLHNRTLEDIQKMEKEWEKTPEYMNKLDLRQLQQDSSIQEVEMGDITDSDEEKEKSKDEEEESQPSSQEVGVPKSKWETDSAAAQLDKLDGIHKKTVKQSMDDFLSVTDDYKTRESAPGKKRVRWADINERQNQRRMRDVGFVVGQTDWSRMMDDSHATQALNRTKFI